MATLDPLADVRTLAEAELLRVRANARVAARRGAFRMVAAFVALVGVVMLVVAGFLALSEAYGSVTGAWIMGGVLIGAAGLLAVLARPLARSGELAEAERASSRARSDLQHDAEALRSVLGLLSGDVSGWSRTGKASILLAAFGAGLGMGLRSRRRRQEETR